MKNKNTIFLDAFKFSFVISTFFMLVLFIFNWGKEVDIKMYLIAYLGALTLCIVCIYLAKIVNLD